MEVEREFKCVHRSTHTQRLKCQELSFRFLKFSHVLQNESPTVVICIAPLAYNSHPWQISTDITHVFLKAIFKIKTKLYVLQAFASF